ncbi:MAG: hypothetical protein L0K89_03810, partial [Bifidobacterium crudilactis]|nr:hypothetical protein [Bifidobacterium crudilactis]
SLRLRFLAELHRTHAVCAGTCRSWVKGYEQVAGAFSQDQFEVMSALSMIRRLQMLGWTTNHREDALPEELATTQASGSVLCAQRYLADSRWLLG